MSRFIYFLPLAFIVASVRSQASLKVQLDEPGHQVSPTLWGLFFEEINHGGDGGLYAELIKNRNLNEKVPTLEGYSVIKSGLADGNIALSTVDPLNSVLTRSLRLTVNTPVSAGERIGISNEGYWGIPIRPDYTSYRASFYAKATNFTGPLTVSIESIDGTITYASAIVPNVTSDFEKYVVILQPSANATQIPRSDNIFVISAKDSVVAGASIFFQVVSLFPPTFNNRPNGMRTDLAQKLADMKPSFFRFPGGNFVEGNNIDERYIWEETIGDISQRPGHQGCWGYYSSDGLGLLEYLELAEDLNSEIVLAIFAGYALNGDSVPIDEMGPHIESALNEIEYVMGNTSTYWGARRALDGHPEPFKLTYVEVGNEDWFSTDYAVRYPLFYDAIRKRYPELVIIATQDVDTRPIPIRDDHFYHGYGWFPDNHAIYDNAPRNGSKIFVGEYQTIDDVHVPAEPNLFAAVSDAAFMTGLERNSDIVVMACFCPLLGQVNDLIWIATNAINYDAVTSYNNPAFWVQHMFSVYQGDTYIPTTSVENETKTFFHVASRNTETNTLILKIVNVSEEDVLIEDVELVGVKSTMGGRVTMLTGGQWDVNTLSDPLKISPKTEVFNVTSNVFSFNAPAFSLTVLEILL